MILPRFDFIAPESLPDACGLMAEAGDEARLLAGGTDLIVKMKTGELRPRLLISLARVVDLHRVQTTPGGGLRIGALASMDQLARSPALSGAWSALAEGAASVAGPIIRNRATVGGNIITARPCADTVPPLIVLDATLHLESTGKTRSVALDGFIAGPGETGIAPDELLTAVELPPPSGGGAGSCYLKITRRGAMDVTIVGCAAGVVLDETRRTVTRARVALTSVAPVPLRVQEAERPIEGEPTSRAAVRASAAAARRAARPIDDHRAPAGYREAMVEVLTERALKSAIERAGGTVT
jgi:carbon-monoxide dehydrogenase medium subunit